MDISSLAAELVAAATAKGVTIGLAESCTGGLLSACITDIAGSSAVLQASLVTYSNEAKVSLLGVPAEVIVVHGAVSAEVAAAMVNGVLARIDVDLVISITGIAGPSGGSTEKPIGTVWFGFGQRGRGVVTFHELFSGSRDEIRRQSVAYALKMLSAEL